MLNFINGWRNPRFKIYTEAGVLVDTIELPIVNSDGLVESLEDLKVSHELLNYSIVTDVRGYRITWTLPYTEYANVGTMMKIQQLLRYHKANYKVILIPRIDNPSRKFEVTFSGDTIEMGIKKGGVGAVGNRLIELKYTTKYLIEDPKWIDPNAVIYATWYNHNRFNVVV